LLLAIALVFALSRLLFAGVLAEGLPHVGDFGEREGQVLGAAADSENPIAFGNPYEVAARVLGSSGPMSCS